VRYIAQLSGGEDKLKGKKIVNLHLNVPYGKETIPIWDKLAEKFGFEVKHLAVPPPGIDQKSLWLQIREYNPDWVVNRNWGVSCTEPLREAARIGFPRDKMLGVWCGSEEDVSGWEICQGLPDTNFHGVGRDFPVTKRSSIRSTRLKREPGPRLASSTIGVIHGIITTGDAPGPPGLRGPIGGEQMQWAWNIGLSALKRSA
jgi:hypothetical protein